MNTTETVPIERLTTYRFLYYSLLQFLRKIDYDPKNISTFFENLHNTTLTNYKTSDWFELVKQCLDDLYPRNKTDKDFTSNPVGMMGSTCWINFDIEKKFIYNVINYSFINCYPHLITKLYKEGKMKFNNDRIGDLFGDILNIQLEDVKWWVENARPVINSLIKVDDDILINSLWSFRRMTVNRFYGILASSIDMKYKCNDISQVTTIMNDFWKGIIEKFQNNICHVDTDEIYLMLDDDLDLNWVEKQFKTLGIPFEKNCISKNVKISLYDTLMKSNMSEELQTQIINIDREKKLQRIFDKEYKKSDVDTFICLFLAKRRFLVFDNNFDILQVRGIPTFKSTIKQKVK